MFKWLNQYQWHFDNKGTQDSSGFNDSETGMFKGRPYKGLAKEILQNSLDAKDSRLDPKIPVKVVFEKLEVDSSDIPGAERLLKVTQQCALNYKSGGDGEKTKKLADYARKYLAPGEKVPVLKISDYNTTGAYGVHQTERSVWSSLVRERGATYKSSTAAGSHGVGKFATYAFTNLRTVLYVTRSDYNGELETAFQGKAILTTFVDYLDNCKKLPTTIFGNKETPECDAIFDMSHIPEAFQRYENGTDVIAVGFDSEDIWKEQIAISVLQYCFFAIYEGKLEVEIKDNINSIEINQGNLHDRMEEFKLFIESHPDIEDANFTFDAPDFLEVLEELKARGEEPVVEQFGNRGEVKLYLLVDSKYPDKKVYEMRKAGMQIMEDSGFSYPAYFRAVFIATGEGSVSDDPKDNIDAFLRLCEDQAHNEWSGEYFEGTKEEKAEARQVIKQIHNFVLNNVKAKAPRIDGDKINAFGLSDLIPNKFDRGENSQEEKAFGDYTPVAFTIKKSKHNNAATDISVPSNAWGKKRKIKEDEDDSDTGKKIKKKPNNKQTLKTKRMASIPITQLATPYDSITETYLVSFIPGRNADKALLELRTGTDDRKADLFEVKDIKMNGLSLETEGNFIKLGKLVKGSIVNLNVVPRNKNVYSLEVNLYAKL